MSFIGVINIISIIIILILEKVNLIGLLKALGATENSIRKYYFYIASFLISKGLLIGNLISVLIIFFQKKFKIIKLDPSIYYVDFLPLEITFMEYVFANFQFLSLLAQFQKLFLEVQLNLINQSKI